MTQPTETTPMPYRFGLDEPRRFRNRFYHIANKRYKASPARRNVPQIRKKGEVRLQWGLDDITPDYDRTVTFQTKTEAIREMHALGNYTRLTDKYPIRNKHRWVYGSGEVLPMKSKPVQIKRVVPKSKPVFTEIIPEPGDPEVGLMDFHRPRTASLSRKVSLG
jgi:hypothetical protein